MHAFLFGTQMIIQQTNSSNQQLVDFFIHHSMFPCNKAACLDKCVSPEKWVCEYLMLWTVLYKLWQQLISFIATHAVLRFGLVIKTVLTSHPCFS